MLAELLPSSPFSLFFPSFPLVVALCPFLTAGQDRLDLDFVEVIERGNGLCSPCLNDYLHSYFVPPRPSAAFLSI